MSAAPTHSTLAQASASRRISDPRAPAPIMPRRTRSLAASALVVARAPATPLATLPMKIRRDCIALLLGGEFLIIASRLYRLYCGRIQMSSSTLTDDVSVCVPTVRRTMYDPGATGVPPKPPKPPPPPALTNGPPVGPPARPPP